MKTIINQVHSIGDIIFLEPMFRYFWKERGQKPLVPMRDHLMWLQDYIESAIFIKLSMFPKCQGDTMEHSDEFINTRFANQILRGYAPNDHHDFENMMPDKYRLVGLDPDMWQEVKLNFDEDRGYRLSKLILGNPKKYILLNENSQAGQIKIINDDFFLPCYPMREVAMFNVIDWYMMMVDAEENHHVSTCTFYIMQAIKNRFAYWDSRVVIYPRPNIDGLRGISQLKTSFKYELGIC